jgi:hypothetical protein
MKTIFTLIASVLLAASSFAQHRSDNQRNYDDDQDVSYNNGRYNRDHHDRRDDRYNFDYRERDMQIAQINREYNRKIESVKHRWFMSHSRKESIICQLDDQRRYEIKRVYEKFNRRNNRFDDDGYKRHW